MVQIESYLERLGLTNRSSESWGVLASAQPVKVEAYCTSSTCGGPNWSPSKKELGSARPDDRRVPGRSLSCHSP